MYYPVHRLARAMAVLLSALCLNVARAADSYVFHHENVMGTSLELQVLADSDGAARWAEDRVLREIDRLATIFNSYDPRSEISRWQAAPKSPIKVSPELFEILRLSDHFHRSSGGAFDPRVEVPGRGARWIEDASELAGARSLMN